MTCITNSFQTMQPSVGAVGLKILPNQDTNSSSAWSSLSTRSAHVVATRMLMCFNFSDLLRPAREVGLDHS